MNMSDTSPDLLYLSRSDLSALGGSHSQPYVDAIVDGLAAHARGDYVQPLKPYLRWPGADHIADRIIAMPCYLGGEQPVAGLKWVGSRQHNPVHFGLERASAVIVLNDAETNYPIAILEGGLISGMRTAAITAVGTRYLAREGFTDVGLYRMRPDSAHADADTAGAVSGYPSVSICLIYPLRRPDRWLPYWRKATRMWIFSVRTRRNPQ